MLTALIMIFKNPTSGRAYGTLPFIPADLYQTQQELVSQLPGL